MNFYEFRVLCHISNIVNKNIFVWLFIYFNIIWIKIFYTDYIIQKVVCSFCCTNQAFNDALQFLAILKFRFYNNAKIREMKKQFTKRFVYPTEECCHQILCFFYFTIFYIGRRGGVTTDLVLLWIFTLYLMTYILVKKKENFFLLLFTTHNTCVDDYKLDLGWQ